MSESAEQPEFSPPTEETTSAPKPHRADHDTTSVAPLATDRGTTSVADIVVAKVAGIATRDVEGVHALGGTAARAVGAIRGRIGGSDDITQGINVEVGERQAAVDIDLVAVYGVPLADLAAAIRTSVVDAIEHLTGLEVTEVNIAVHDVWIEDDGEEAESRVE